MEALVVVVVVVAVVVVVVLVVFRIIVQVLAWSGHRDVLRYGTGNVARLLSRFLTHFLPRGLPRVFTQILTRFLAQALTSIQLASLFRARLPGGRSWPAFYARLVRGGRRGFGFLLRAALLIAAPLGLQVLGSRRGGCFARFGCRPHRRVHRPGPDARRPLRFFDLVLRAGSRQCL